MAARLPPPIIQKALQRCTKLIGNIEPSPALRRLEGPRGLGITADYIQTFFDVYLKGGPRTDLDALKRKYPEVLDDSAELPRHP